MAGGGVTRGEVPGVLPPSTKGAIATWERGLGRAAYHDHVHVAVDSYRMRDRKLGG